MYAVSSVLFRRTRWRKKLFFPVRGRFFYDSVGGLLVNFVMGWWSMFPPFFTGGDSPRPEKREFDKFTMRLLTELCREGAGNVVGFHPEGKRNKGEDPYTYLRPQPGIGKLVKDARPQVVPVFIAGLGNDLFRQVLGNWRGGQPVRIHFGPAARPLRLLRPARARANLQRDRRIRHVQNRRTRRTGPRPPRARSRERSHTSVAFVLSTNS